MKKFWNFIFSSKATIIFMFAIGLAMAIATLVEDKYDTATANLYVYKTIWFEILFVILAFNLIGHIKVYNLLSRKKIAGFIFHISFIVMIIGAAITRYISYEGSMHIREGSESNLIYTNDIILAIKHNEKTYEYPVVSEAIKDKKLNLSIPVDANGSIDISIKDFIPDAVESYVENTEKGVDILHLSVLGMKGLQNVYIESGKAKDVSGVLIGFKAEEKDAVNIIEENGILKIKSPYPVEFSTMAENSSDSIPADSAVEFKENFVYHINNTAFVFSKLLKKAEKKLIRAEKEGSGSDAIILEAKYKSKTFEIIAANKTGYANDFDLNKLDDQNLNVALGFKTIELPFSLFLKKFIFEKYPGSESPSSYQSDVILIDNRKNLKEEHSIYMNNVLDYNQYRFFQSSYDTDEKGTILSVNHDFWGTLVSYIGYALMIIGFIITLFNKNSRFLFLRRAVKDVRNSRKSITTVLILLFGFTSFGFAQNKKAADKLHVEKFGNLLIQTYDGRFAPVHTLALDVMHKIAKKESFEVEGKGKMNTMQAFMDMMLDPELWQEQKIIYVPQKAIRDIIGINSEYASFRDFFDERQAYKLDTYINESFRKKQNEKNKTDREILKVDERLNLFYMTINGSILKIFPEQDSKNHKWISWDEKSASIPLSGSINIINEELKLKTFNYASLLQAYMFELSNATQNGDYTKADKIMGYISDIQKQYTDPSILPSETKIAAEVFYNKANIFVFLKNIYMIMSVLLLVFAFIENVKSGNNKLISIILNVLTIILGLAFLYHSFGMALRWYITGHAPWANGYEALILVGWGALIAGFSFAKHSKITLAATTLLAFFVLMTASHSSYDPQLTNLQPVLKSYWLIIHVATLTVSYGFLGLGFIMGIMNLLIYLIKNKSNEKRLDLLITENTYIIEMNLIIGLMLATIGTFLGAVWANESWGRYWGWDAKETWALIIVITYTIATHMRFIPKLNNKFAFNVASVLSFASVIMTFVGVNYYLSKGMHSYGAGDTPIFPLWAWGTIFAVFILIISASVKENRNQTIK